MNLSLGKKRGHIHVRGGRALRVVKTHEVNRASASRLEPTSKRDRTPFAKPGDLAIEIVKAKKSEPLVGYAYLSGDAIRLHHYDAKPEWFEPIDSFKLTFDRPESVEGQQELCLAIVILKYAARVVAIDYRLQPGEGEPCDVVDWIHNAYTYVTDDLEATGHVFTVAKPSGKRKGPALGHAQPASDADEHGVSQFQIQLVVSSRHHKVVTPKDVIGSQRNLAMIEGGDGSAPSESEGYNE